MDEKSCIPVEAAGFIDVSLGDIYLPLALEPPLKFTADISVEW